MSARFYKHINSVVILKAVIKGISAHKGIMFNNVLIQQPNDTLQNQHKITHTQPVTLRTKQNTIIIIIIIIYFHKELNKHRPILSYIFVFHLTTWSVDQTVARPILW